VQVSHSGSVTASVWEWCESEDRCVEARYAVAVSRDGFATRTVVDLPPRWLYTLRPAGGGRFFVRGNPRVLSILQPDGSLREVTRPLAGAEPAPAEPDELLLHTRRGWVATDAEDASQHPVPVPADVEQLWWEGDQLRGVTYPDDRRSAFVRSDDGGLTWRSTQLPVRHALWGTVDGASPPVFVEGADGATLMPFVALHRLDPATGTWRSTPGPADPTAYHGSMIERPDGRLFVIVQAWSDARRFDPGTPPGFWVSTDEAWTDFEQIETGPPFTRVVSQPRILERRSVGRVTEITVDDPDSPRAWTTRDWGRTWREISVR